MPTLIEATWDGWFEEHDARVSTQGMTQGRERDLAKGGSRMPRDWVLECETGDEQLERVDGLRTPSRRLKVRHTPTSSKEQPLRTRVDRRDRGTSRAIHASDVRAALVAIGPATWSELIHRLRPPRGRPSRTLRRMVGRLSRQWRSRPLAPRHLSSQQPPRGRHRRSGPRSRRLTFACRRAFACACERQPLAGRGSRQGVGGGRPRRDRVHRRTFAGTRRRLAGTNTQGLVRGILGRVLQGPHPTWLRCRPVASATW